jgi:hypothetical protein
MAHIIGTRRGMLPGSKYQRPRRTYVNYYELRYCEHLFQLNVSRYALFCFCLHSHLKLSLVSNLSFNKHGKAILNSHIIPL